MSTDWIGSATFGSGGKYRYVLRRKFLFGDKIVVFIMLNPSTATAEQSDPTVTRCEKFSQRWGYGELVVLNIFALRSTDPKKLYRDDDPVGPENDMYIKMISKEASLVVCAWGIHGTFLARDAEVAKMIAPYKPHYLKLTKHGIPGHPLYLSSKLEPKPWLMES